MFILLLLLLLLLSYFKGFTYPLFARTSWLFTDVLIFQLFYIVVYKRYFLNVKYMHCIVWTLNIILQCLPLTTGTFYGDDDESAVFTCVLSNGTGSNKQKLMWYSYTINIEILFSICFICTFTILIIVYSRRMKESEVHLAERIQNSWSLVIWYPCALLIGWLPITIYLMYIEYGGVAHHYALFLNYLSLFSCFYGVMLSIIFYTKTLDARRAWIHNFKYISSLIMGVELDIDDRTTCSSILSVHDRDVSRISQISNNSHKSITFGLWMDKRNQSVTDNPMNDAVRIIEL